MAKRVKEQESIPVSKVLRAGKFISTGAKIGTNYLKHYSKKLVNPDLPKDELHLDNASDIYKSLSELKGSALKVAQMLSMDKNLLPGAYQQKFAMAQYSAPPLSYPLVARTFEKYFKKKPGQLFDTFSQSAQHAASMGQVHKAEKNGKTLAVKIQYPGVASSVKSDLTLIKPIALSMFKLNPVEYNEFIGEVESRLLEETDYTLELQRSLDLTKQCQGIHNLVFPSYYPDLSCEKILTMDWLDGKPLGDFLKTEKWSHDEARLIGQALWDFYSYQIHQLKTVHADPHPGNFIITPDRKLGIIDFGCVKVIPPAFYKSYFQLLDGSLIKDESRMEKVFYEMRFVYPDDSTADKVFFTSVFKQLVELLSQPFQTPFFNFAEKGYFEKLYQFGEQVSTMKEFRNSKRARGVKDALYINRTYYGIFNILHDLKAEIRTERSW